MLALQGGARGAAAGAMGGTAMTWFEVDGGEVARAGAAARQCADELAVEVEEMMRHLVELRGSWHGAAAAAFTDVVDRWRATQEQVHGALAQIQAALLLAGRGYDEAEASARRIFSG
jgi:early secretory antigenic target protein ESAT-6